MTQSKILQSEINHGIDTIKTLTENDSQQVYQIFLSAYQKYLNLPKDEFINGFYYSLYKKMMKINQPMIEMELKSLLQNEESVLSDNFFQIKVSMMMFSVEKMIK
jgi:hypothetical protein